jgi:hypothetical protein
MPSFRAFMSKYKPPLTNEQIDAIVAEHERLVSEAVEQQPTATEEE